MNREEKPNKITKDDKIKFLESYRLARIDEYNYLCEADDIASARLFRCSALSGMPSAHGVKHDISDTIERDIDNQWNKYMKLREQSIKKSCRVKDSINLLEDPEEKRILIHKYVLLKQNLKAKTWEEVASETGYCRTTVIEHHNAALKKLIIL